ncbi:substrate-binding domain-containing protein [Mastigocladopsis repens]|uniref:substrate-binding domain-containing protein n=1 Tax=Mastigocladopsis repens TaxID=221287 RepID=UPI00037DE03E|nr:substrate-binding domain-containing protein [Mastigocladopsis repens]
MHHDKALKSMTLQDVAKAMGVSRTTVSNAFNRPDQLSPELRDRVLAVAKEMGYAGPNPMGRMLRTGRTGVIGLVFCEALPYAFQDPVAIAFLQGVSSVCEKVKASLLLVPTLESDAAQMTIQQAAVDGFIVYSMPDDSEAVAKVLERKLPVIAVDQPNLSGVPLVCLDDRQAAREAALHLLRLNHRRLAIISMALLPDSYVGLVNTQRLERTAFQISLLRLRGYEDAMLKAGLDLSKVPIVECPPRNSEDDAFEVALTLLKQEPRPTGILAMCDVLAIGALRAAEHFGLSVPKDLSIVGFDDIPLASQIRPSLTTIQQPLIEKGAIAAKLLLCDAGLMTSKVLETKLVVRESSGPVPAGF